MKDIILIDFETTGTNADMRDPAGHDPVQLGAVRLDGDTLEEKASFCSLIKPERLENAVEFAMQLHGIPVSKLLEAPESSEVLREFEKAMLGADLAMRTDKEALTEIKENFVLAAQYLTFDHSFLKLLYERAGINMRRLGRNELCTRIIAQFLIRTGHLETEENSASLDAQRKALGLAEREGVHDALDDVRLTAEVLRLHEGKLRRELAKAEEFERLSSFLQDRSPELWEEFKTSAPVQRQEGAEAEVVENKSGRIKGRMMKVRARTYSDDHRREIEFDARDWFRLVSDEAIVELMNCDWGGDYPADDVARAYSDKDWSPGELYHPDIAEMFEYISDKHFGFECRVDEDDTLHWLLNNRPHLLIHHPDLDWVVLGIPYASRETLEELLHHEEREMRVAAITELGKRPEHEKSRKTDSVTVRSRK